MVYLTMFYLTLCSCVRVFVCSCVRVFVCSWNRDLGTWDCVHVGLCSCRLGLWALSSLFVCS